MSKTILQDKNARLYSYFRSSKAAEDARVSYGLMAAIYDVILLKYLNAPEDQEHIKIGDVDLDTKDLVLAQQATGTYDLVISRYGINELRQFVQSISIPPEPSYSSATCFDMETQRHQFVRALEYHLEHPKDKSVVPHLVKRRKFQKLYMDVNKPELHSKIVRESHLIHGEQAISTNPEDDKRVATPRMPVDFGGSRLDGVLPLVERSFMKRKRGDENFSVLGVSIPASECMFGFRTNTRTRLHVFSTALPQLREIKAIADKREKDGTNEGGISDEDARTKGKGTVRNKEWLRSTEVATLIGVGAQHISMIFGAACRDGMGELLKTPEGRARVSKREGNVRVRFGINGMHHEADLPLKMLKAEGNGYLCHRDLVEPLKRFLVETVGMELQGSGPHRPRRM